MTAENSKRFIAILNKKIEVGRLMNALGHMTAGLSGGFGIQDQMGFIPYIDGDEGLHPNISNFAFIILKADNSNQIRKVRTEALSRGVKFTDFTHTMIVGTSKEQIERTKNTKELDLEYFGICMFGDSEVLKEFTSKFSLFN
ncbi:MAG: hypothetical protein JWP09_456 [Candidatus Taylorbacteria bacterium]|nr:hypothetical protein [Candidatus Taylorbacteria bacterium]